jgi:predicted DNA-binding transcriptional regulator YafY
MRYRFFDDRPTLRARRSRAARPPARSWLGKVVRALPESVGREAAARVRVGYRGDSGEEWDAEVDPWAVVVRFGRWYLLCHSHRAGAVRTYRVDRIRSVGTTGHHFEPPAGLEPVASLEQHLGTGWRCPVRVAFDVPTDEVRPWLRGPMGRLEPDGEGCVLLGSTRNPAMHVSEWGASVPFTFRVEDGPELREAVAALSDRLAQSIGRSSSA